MDITALFTLNYGLYVVGSRSGDRLNGQIANSVFQITAEPVRIAVAINREELTHEFISKTRMCCIGVLSTDADLPFIGHFGFKSGRDLNKFETVPYVLAPSGCPYPEKNILAFIDLRIKNSVDIGSHTLFVGELIDCVVTGTGKPMTYSWYREVLCGKTPPTAPSYMASTSSSSEKGIGKESKSMKKYVCDVCGYVYDPEKGDSDSGIAAGTAFSDLPDDWVCPVCGVGKDQFSEQ